MSSRKFHINSKQVPAQQHAVWDIMLPPDARKITGVMFKAYNRNHATVEEQKRKYPDYIGPEFGYAEYRANYGPAGDPEMGEIFHTDAELRNTQINNLLAIADDHDNYYLQEIRQAAYGLADHVIQLWQNLPDDSAFKVLQMKEAVNLFENEVRTYARSRIDNFFNSGPDIWSDQQLKDFINDAKDTIYNKNDTLIYVMMMSGSPPGTASKSIHKIYEILSAALIDLHDNGDTETYYYSPINYDEILFPDIADQWFSEIMTDLFKNFVSEVRNGVVVPFVNHVVQNSASYFSWPVYMAENMVYNNWTEFAFYYWGTSNYNQSLTGILNHNIRDIVYLNPKITPAKVLYTQEIVGNITLLTNAGYEILERDFPVQLNDTKVTVRTDLLEVKEPVFIGSQARVVFKNNFTFTDNIIIDVYFEYEK